MVLVDVTFDFDGHATKAASAGACWLILAFHFAHYTMRYYFSVWLRLVCRLFGLASDDHERAFQSFFYNDGALEADR